MDVFQFIKWMLKNLKIGPENSRGMWRIDAEWLYYIEDLREYLTQPCRTMFRVFFIILSRHVLNPVADVEI